MTRDPRKVLASTVRALLAPRRLVPILAVVAPTSWRALFPAEAPPRTTGAAIVHALGYLALGVVAVAGVGIAIPRLVGMGDTFLTTKSSLVIDLALFGAGGWGLGRDIDFEETLVRTRARGAALEREAERAQLLALQSHLDPHFLFNTLNAIAEWCRQDGEVAERAILQLSSILRTVMEGVRVPAWPLARELELVGTLFALHLIRDPALFTLESSIDEGASAIMVPPMILLPLAENAMKHGPSKGARGKIALAASIDGGVLRVRLENPGAFAGRRDGGSGLRTVEQRLSLAYGGGADLAIRGESARTIAEVVLPLEGPRP